MKPYIFGSVCGGAIGAIVTQSIVTALVAIPISIAVFLFIEFLVGRHKPHG